MRLTRYRPGAAARIELSTPGMIDVVFLLLIFFIASTTFLSPERQLSPAITVDQRATGSEFQLEPLEIEIRQQDGQPAYRSGATWSSRLSTLLPIIRGYPDKSAGAWIRLADDVPFRMAARAINTCRQEGFAAVSLVPLE